MTEHHSLAHAKAHLSEIIDDGVNGQLLEPRDAAGWTAALSRAATDPALIDRWRRALRAPRTMDDIAADYLALYAA